MFKHRRQKLITLFGWAALVLLSLACGIPPPRPTRPFPIPGGPDDDSGTPLSHPDREFPLQLASVNSVSFDPTGRWMATAGEDGAVSIWDFREVRLALRMREHSGAVTSVAFAPDGKFLASAGKDKSVKLWDATTGQLLRTLSGHAGEIRSVAFSPDGKLLASGGADAMVILWDTQSGREQAVLKGHTAAINAVAFSPDGATLASASDDKTVRLWDVKTGALLQSLTGHMDPVLAVVFSPDGQRLASAAATVAPLNHHGTLKSWDATSGREAAAPPFRFAVSALAFRPDGKALALAYFGDDRLWNIEALDVRDRRPLRHYVAHRRRITQLAYSPDGAWLVSVSADKAIRGWH